MTTKLVGELLLPLPVALALLLAAVLLRRLGRRRAAGILGTLGLLVLWAASTPAVAGALLRAQERRFPPVRVEDTPSAEAIVVLGGAITPVHPPRVYPDLSRAADRVLHAARLHRAGKAPRVIVAAGALPGRTPEAASIVELLVEWGVPREAVAAEDVSGTTRQNAEQVARILRAEGTRRILLVTSAAHMARAMGAFRAVGLEPVAATTDVESGDAPVTVLDLIPSAAALETTSRVAREAMGQAYYGLRGWTSDEVATPSP